LDKQKHFNFLCDFSLVQVMANLNFQQPPRIPSASLSRSTNSGFTSNSISGNVTPTSSLMFQSSQQQQSVNNSSYVTTPGQQQQQNQQQQLSPNRAGQLAAIGGGNIVAPPMGNRRMYGNPPLQQRDDFNTRRMTGGLGGGAMNMGTFMQTGRYGSQSGTGGINNFSAFSSSDTPPTLLDMSEFPSLTNARQNDQHSSVLQAPGSKPYGKLYVPRRRFCLTHDLQFPLQSAW
jgi:CCR4-NOT transcription complex subunit 2